MAYRFIIRRMVEFSETDMAGIMHFSNYFRWMEATEHAFFREHGLSVHEQSGAESAGWARVHAECQYESPLRYQDEAEIEILVTRKSTRSLSYACTIRRISDRRRIARGAMTVVYVEKNASGALESKPMPERVAQTIVVAPDEELAKVNYDRDDAE